MFLAFEGIFIFFIFAGIAVALIVASRNHSKKVRATWQSVAHKYRMQLQHGANMGSKPQLSGNVNGIFVNVHTETRGSGKNRSTYTVYSAIPSGRLPHGIALTREGFFSKVGKVFGGQDIQVGNRKLDESLVIKASDVNGTINLLRVPQVRDALLYFVARHPGMVVNGQNIKFEEHGVTSKPERMSAAIDDLVYLVGTFDTALSGPVPAPKSSPSRQPIQQVKLSELSEPFKVGGGKSAPAEILMDTRTDPNGIEARTEMESAFASLKSKVGNPTVHKKEAPTSTSVSLDSAFDAPPAGDAFVSPVLDENVFAPTQSEFVPPAPAFETPKWDDDPAAEPELASSVDVSTGAVATDSQDEVCEGSTDIYDVIKELSNVGFGGDRQAIIDTHNCVTYNLMVYVDRVDSTFGFDTPDHLKDGKTLEGHLGSGEKVAVRFPKSMNDKVGKLHSGGEIGVSGNVVAWDDLFKKVAIDYAE
ncbi:hypothetical protein OAU50_08695 [Planctomycetota bacterium]|nr:hypothetical protein [Planctomycetota bacterium]